MLCCCRDRTFKRKQATFLGNPACIINFESSPEDASVLSRLFSKPYVTLEGSARWGLGIVSGNNKKFCNDAPGDDLMAVYKGVDIHKGRLDESTTFIPSDLSLYQQVAPVELFEADEKIWLSLQAVCVHVMFFVKSEGWIDMDHKQFQEWLSGIDHLSPAQRQQTEAVFLGDTETSASLAAIEAAVG